MKQEPAAAARRVAPPGHLARSESLSLHEREEVNCVGTLTEGHVGPEALDELVRVARPGASVVVTVIDRIWEPLGYKAQVEKLEKAGAARLEEAAPQSAYHVKENITCNLVVLRAT